MLTAIARRITKIERQIEKAAGEIRAKDCNCFQHVCAISGKLSEFEAEMTKTCPVHGFRRLRPPIVILDVGPDDPDRRRVGELLDRYHTQNEEYERGEQN